MVSECKIHGSVGFRVSTKLFYSYREPPWKQQSAVLASTNMESSSNRSVLFLVCFPLFPSFSVCFLLHSVLSLLLFLASALLFHEHWRSKQRDANLCQQKAGGTHTLYLESASMQETWLSSFYRCARSNLWPSRCKYMILFCPQSVHSSNVWCSQGYV